MLAMQRMNTSDHERNFKSDLDFSANDTGGKLQGGRPVRKVFEDHSLSSEPKEWIATSESPNSHEIRSLRGMRD